MPPPADPIAEVKAALLDTFQPLVPDPLGAVLDYEPLQAPKLPLLSLMTRGYARAGLETAEVRPPIGDPLMGRRWVWSFWARISVALRSEVDGPQRELDSLVATVVRQLEGNRSLGGVAVDAAMASGDVAWVRPEQGQPLLVMTCELDVETEENLS